jgi:tripeptide aminopeptidase
MDGGELGELEFENFNAAAAKVEINGVSVHPGYAKGKMINAGRVAAEFVSLMPTHETPETTTEYEGFFHLLGIEGGVEKASLSYIIRDHDRNKFEARKAFVEQTTAWLNAKYGEGTVKVTLNDQYYNMRQQIEPVMHVIDIAFDAMKECGVTPRVRAIRGGTDGAQLSFKGLPCPNVFAGGLNFHGPHEFLPIPSLEKASEVVVKICELTAQR